MLPDYRERIADTLKALLKRYTRWLHTQWPAGTVERVPVIGDDGETSIPGVTVVGDLTGIPLLKFASRTGANAARAATRSDEPAVLDLAIIGGGVAGISAAIEAKKTGLRFEVFEATDAFSTIINFPKAKPIYTYPADMKLDGGLQLQADIKEDLVDEIEQQRRSAGIEVRKVLVDRIEKTHDGIRIYSENGSIAQARQVIVAIGRSGNHRKLGCPGEDLDKVYNRLHDPKDFRGKDVLVVGGGDSALEAATALAKAGARVTLSYRRKEFSRAKEENVAALSDCPVRVLLGTEVARIDPESVVLKDGTMIPNDVVFTMLGREAPLDFFRKSGIKVRGDWTAKTWASFLAFFAFCCFLYLWKGGTELNQAFQKNHWFPYNVSTAGSDPRTLLGTLAMDLNQPGFYYSLAYCAVVVGFGWRRIRRRRTPYVRAQTLSLMAFQVIPLFLLPYLILAVDGTQRLVRLRLDEDCSRSTLSTRELRTWTGILARFRVRARLAVVHLECLHGAAALVVACDFIRADLCPDSVDPLSMGQRGVLRMDLLLRRSGGDTRRHASREDASRSCLEPAEYGGAGYFADRVCPARIAHCELDKARVRYGEVVWRAADELVLARRSAQLLSRRRHFSGRNCRCRNVLLVQRSRVVPLRLPARGADAHLHAIFEIPNICREEEVHFLQCVHVGMPPRDRRNELRE